MTDSDSVDLQARKVIMAAYLYYERNVSLLTDAEFDSLSVVVAAELDWLDAMGDCAIDPVRCVQLGSGDELRVSGYHIRMTQMSVSGACAWYNSRRPRAKKLRPECKVADYQVEPSSAVLMRGLSG